MATRRSTAAWTSSAPKSMCTRFLTRFASRTAMNSSRCSPPPGEWQQLPSSRQPRASAHQAASFAGSALSIVTPLTVMPATTPVWPGAGVRSGLQHDLARHALGGLVHERVACVGERIHRADLRAQLTGVDEAGDLDELGSAG